MPSLEPWGNPHDVLAAEEFAMPSEDPDLHHGPVRLPEDPSGIPEPHDVLAAEEFAMPAPRRSSGLQSSMPGSGRSQAIVAALALLGVAVLARLLRSR
jgi:hypothetical protein